MEIIGISGNPGAGKTTLANSLFLEFNTRVIHLDHILDCVKEILPNNMFISINRDTSENIKLLKKGILYKQIKNNKYLLWTYLNSKWELSRIILNKMLYDFAKDDVDYVIIEGFNLETIISLDELDCSVLVDAPLDIRLKRVCDRNHPKEIMIGGNPAYEDLADTSDLSRYNYYFINDCQGDKFYNRVMNLQLSIFNHKSYARGKKL